MSYYNLIKKDINQLPLAELGRQFLAFRDLSWKKHVLEKTEFLKQYEPNADIETTLIRTFSGLGSAETLEWEVIVTRFADTYQIPKNASWFFPQCLARLAQVKLPRNTEGLISARKLVKDYYSKDNFLTGIYSLCIYPKRGILVKNQTSEASRNFSKLVPLIMSAYAQYSNVCYEEWDRDEVVFVVDPDLYTAMNKYEESLAYWEALSRGYIPNPATGDYGDDRDYGLDVAVVLGWRNDALTIKTGDKRGVIRSPLTTYSTSPSEDNPLKELDPLSRHMFMQTWCAHPDIRTDLMILDPVDWDSMPEPLISIDCLHTSPEQEIQNINRAFSAKATTSSEAPW